MFITSIEHLENTINEMKQIEESYNELESWIILMWDCLDSKTKEDIYNNIGWLPMCL